MPARRRATTGTLLAGLVLLSGCGSSEPAALEPLPPEVPADLCSVIPEASRAGLLVAHTTSMGGNPTAACSLRSADGAADGLRAVVTWTHYDTDTAATDVLASQCRSIDPQEYQVQQAMALDGADETCGGTGRSADSTSIAVARGREVMTVRVTVTPAGGADKQTRQAGKTDGTSTGQSEALTRGRQLLEDVLASIKTGA